MGGESPIFGSAFYLRDSEQEITVIGCTDSETFPFEKRTSYFEIRLYLCSSVVYAFPTARHDNYVKIQFILADTF